MFLSDKPIVGSLRYSNSLDFELINCVINTQELIAMQKSKNRHTTSTNIFILIDVEEGRLITSDLTSKPTAFEMLGTFTLINTYQWL